MRGPDHQQQRCKACGRPDKFDFYVPDGIWKAVVPQRLRNRVVCLSCFDDFARERNIGYASHVSDVCFVGKHATLVFEITSARD